jgi:hypothetical protein
MDNTLTLVNILIKKDMRLDDAIFAADDATAMTVVTETVADYGNLDIPVLDAIQSLVSPQFRENLRCIVGIGIYNYLTKRAITLVTGAANPIMDFNALPEYSANLNIAGYPVVLDKTAPANMIFITRTKQSDPLLQCYL